MKGIIESCYILFVISSHNTETHYW